MCLDNFVAFKAGCMYSFLLFMVLIARCVRSEVSLSSEQCSPVSLNHNLESDFLLNHQISNLSDRVHDLQEVLYNAIQHYGPQVMKMIEEQCEGYVYTSETFQIPICNVFNNLPESVRSSCPEGTMCDTQIMKQPVVSNNSPFPWPRGSSVLCDHETSTWEPIPHHIPVLQTFHTQLVGNIYNSAQLLQQDALINSIDVMANTFHDVLCGMETTRQRLNHPSLSEDESYERSSIMTYDGVSLDLQNVVIMQSLQDTLEHIDQDLRCLNFMQLPSTVNIAKRSSMDSKSFPAWLAQQRQARLRKKKWSNDNVISKLLKSLRH